MSETQTAAGSIAQIDIGLMDISKAEFYITEGGFTGLRYNGEDYRHITLRRPLPVAQPMEYISVADHENKEIGILRNVDDLSDAQRAIVLAELDSRYYCPDVLEVLSIKDKLGYVYMELRLARNGEAAHMKSCAIKDVSRNIRMLGDDRLLIFDVDGNRYIVRSLAQLDKKSMHRLEPYMF